MAHKTINVGLLARSGHLRVGYIRRNVTGAVSLSLLLLATLVHAEPYLAVKSGHGCGTCHVNPSGGGARTTFGQLYAQTSLSAYGREQKPWTGQLHERIAIGGDARVAASQSEFDDRDDNLDFGVERVTLYGALTLNDRVTLYLDQQIAPGGSLNREAWVKLNWGSRYIKAGRLFLPFGWRLEDNTAFVRQGSGINMTQGDDGLEFGDSGEQFDWQLAITNGNGGGAEVDDGKLFALRAAWRFSTARIGMSALHNSTDNAERLGYGLFAGWRTGPVAWLLEVDQIEDEVDGLPDQDLRLGLLEANWMVRQGHNLKFTVESSDVEDEPAQYRYSFIYELFAWPMSQIRGGIRWSDSDENTSALNSEQAFVELHAYF